MIYSIVSACCIAVMIAIILWFVLKLLFKRNRAEKIEFIKSFKKGKCAIIYIVAIPLYLLADLFAGKTVGVSVFNSVSKAVYLVVLKYDVSIALIDKNALFASALYLCFALVIVNACMITISFFHQAIWHAFKRAQFQKANQDKCMIVGNNNKSRMIYDSCTCRKSIVGVLSKEEQEKLYISDVFYQSCDGESHFSEWLNKKISKCLSELKKAKRKLKIIINNDTEKKNLDQCGRLLEMIQSLQDSDLPFLDVYVFGDREFEDIYAQYEAKSKGCLHYVNEYQQIAIDFIDRYPLTEFMNENHIDYRTSLLKPETDIHVAMIGFGRTNQQIFLSMVANNQFLTKDSEGKPVAKQVEYHMFDKLHPGNHKNLNHNYFRYQYTFLDQSSKIDPNAYLPFPPSPSTEHYYFSDVNDMQFYESLKESLPSKDTSVNYIIVSLGMDYASIDMTNKIVAKMKEWKLKNTHLFVRIRDQKTFEDSNLFLDMNYCRSFGAERDTVYNYDHIIQETFTEMAIRRNYNYDIEHDLRHNCATAEEEERSRLKWYTQKTTTERESNSYCCLSLRNKLHLMGMDYRKKGNGDGEALSQEKYLSIYAGEDMPEIIYNPDHSIKAFRYSLQYPDSRRKNMAIQEHQRWNAFMILKGFIPARKEEILSETDADGKYTNGRNYAMRHHGNLTTFDGLEIFRKMLAKRDMLPEENFDVMKYDYQLLDGAWRLLNDNGYEIIERRSI